ncbi:MAG: PAS domain-containing protein [Alphaproteobacteria bacterium]
MTEQPSDTQFSDTQPSDLDRLVAAHASTALICMTRDGKILWANKAAGTLLDLPGPEGAAGDGKAPRSAKRPTFFEGLSPFDRGTARERLLDTPAWPLRMTLCWSWSRPRGKAARRDAPKRWIAVSITPLPDQDDLLTVHLRDATLDVASRDAVLTAGDMLRRLEQIGRVGLWWWYPQTDETHWSEGIYATFGLTPSDHPLDRTQAFGVYGPEDRNTLEHLMDKAAEEGQSFAVELGFSRPDGSTGSVRVRGDVERDDKGGVTCVYGLVEDITEEMETLSALKISEDRYIRTVRGSGIGLWDWDISAERIHASAGLMTLLGYDAQDTMLEFSFFASHIHGDDRAGILAALESCLEGRGPLRSEFRMHRRNGQVFWVRATAEPRFGKRGRPESLSGSLLDITPEKSSQLALEASNAKLTHLVDSSAALLYTAPLPEDDGIKGFEVSLSSVSGSVRHLLGYALDGLDAAPLALTDLIHPDDLPALDEALSDLSKTDRVACEYRLRHQDGSYRWFHDDMRLVHDPVTRRREIIGCAVDFTSAKAAEKALIDARNEAETANRAKSDFLAMMSHEIRTPMNAILGMLDVLRRDDLEPRQIQHVTLAKDSAINLLNILNDILDFSKLDAGQMQVERIDFEPRRIIEGALSVLQPKAEEKGLVLESMIDPGIPPVVKGDPNRLRQILLNLVSNAVKFTETGSVQIIAIVKRASDQGIVVKFEVTDTGIGIAEDVAEKLFSRFVQADTSIKRRFGGTGLGLAISKQLCELMDGRIGVDSAPGDGSTFWFTLPFGASDMTEVVSAPPARTALADLSVRRRILVAEDNPVNQTVIATILDQLGHDCTLAEDGRRAVEMLRQGDYDLVLMDIQMPGMDGLTATKVIRVMPDPVCTVPIIALTANAMAGDREAYMAAGFTAYLSKPIEIDRLQAAIESVFEHRGPAFDRADDGNLPPEDAKARTGDPAQPAPPPSSNRTPSDPEADQGTEAVLSDLIASLG